MDQSPTLTSAPRSQSNTGLDALAPLTFLGWRLGLAAIVVSLTASFFLYGYALVYWRNADMDLMVVYNALALNDGKPQQFFDHTGYLTIVAVKAWFEMLHALGLLDAWSLSTMPPASSPEAFDAAMTSAVRAGRVLAWLIATGAVLVFAGLIRAIVRDWRLALIATFAFAFSGGLAVHERILRTELLAACPVIFAMMILFIIGRRASVVRPLWMALAAALCLLGLENKVQAILLITALPILVLPFGGEGSASVAFWRGGRSSFALAIASVIAATAVGWLAWPLVITGFDRTLLDAVFHPLLLGRFGIYQAAISTLIGACMIAYAVIWRVSAAETFVSMAAVLTGALLALLALNIDYNTNNVIAVFNPLEKMLKFVDAGTMAAANQSSLTDILRLLLDGIASVAARYSFVLHSSPRPTVFLTWLIVPGIAYAWRRGERQAAIGAFFLLSVAIGIDALGVRRGLKSEYFIFTDPLIILAGAVLLDRLSDLRFNKWALPIAVVFFGLQIAIGQAEPIKYAFMRRGPESVCEWNQYYLPLLPLPWCPAVRS